MEFQFLATHVLDLTREVSEVVSHRSKIERLFTHNSMKNKPHRQFSFYPLVQLAAALATGIFVANKLNSKPNFWIAFGIAFTLAALVSACTNRRQTGLTIIIATFFAGGSLASVELNRSQEGTLKSLIENSKVVANVTGTLEQHPEYAFDRMYLTLRVESVSIDDQETVATGLVTLLAPFRNESTRDYYHQLNLAYGDRVVVKTTLDRTDNYRNPGVSTLTEYLDRSGFDASGLIRSPNSIIHVERNNRLRPLRILYRLRESIQREIDKKFSTETAGVLDAALLGNRYNLSKNASERFREGGTFHVLVISGLHISFIGGLILLISRRLTRRRVVQFICSSGLVWLYTLAVGAQSSVARAALMFTFVALGSVLFRQASALNGLGAATLILLVKNPNDLFDPSLQLTLLSVFAIVAVAWPLLSSLRSIGRWYPKRTSPYPPFCSRELKTFCEALYWRDLKWRQEMERHVHHYRLFKTPLAALLEKLHLQSLLRYVFEGLVVSISVQIVLLPLLIVYFHRVTFASLVLNFVVSGLLALLAFVAAAALLLSTLSSALAVPLFWLADGITWLMVHSVDPFSRLGMLSLRLPEYSGYSTWVYFLYYLPLVVLVSLLQHWHPLYGPTTRRTGVASFAMCSQLLLILVVVIHPFSAARADGVLRVDFLDVGQGDSALITMPDGTTLLVDGGGRPVFGSKDGLQREPQGRSIGERVVSEYLWWRGLSSVDYVLATHADADHIEGLNDVVRNFSVRSAIVGRSPTDNADYACFVQSLKSTGTSLQIIQAGDVLTFGSVTATVIWPHPTSATNASENNDSVVLKLSYGDRTILLTGDIEKETEAQLVTRDLKVDVVKVPHHGSRTSSTDGFVAATSPRFAIISVGQTSMFNHPHAEIVERWKKSGAEVLTTGASGTITVRTDGRTISVAKFK